MYRNRLFLIYKRYTFICIVTSLFSVNRLEAAQNKASKPSKFTPKYHPFKADDDDYAPTVGEKRRREKEKLKELSAYKQAEINQQLNNELPGTAERTRLLKYARK